MGSFGSVAAHLVTGLRVAAAPLFAWSILAGRGEVAALLFAVAAATDLADGWVARRLGVSSDAGRWFDHIADIVFLLCGYVALVAGGIAPAVVPVAISASFAFYVGDSLRRSQGRSLIGSRLGHFSGVVNYGILGAVVFDAALGGGVVPPALRDLAFAAVPLYSAAAIIGRLAAR